jgi:hypothetical protein
LTVADGREPASGDVLPSGEAFLKFQSYPWVAAITKSTYLQNAVLEKTLQNVPYTVTNAFLSLHTADPGETGASEVSGGGYARQKCLFLGPSTGIKTSSEIVNFTLMPSATVIAFALWDALSAGNPLYIGWLGAVGEGPKPFICDDVAADTIKAPVHGYGDGDRVFISVEIGATTAPAPLVSGTVYFVRSADADAFQLSATSGGAAINITGKGSGLVQRVTPKIINGGDTLTLQPGQLSVIEY